MTKPEIIQLINNILSGNNSILGSDYKVEYKRLALLFHPDGEYGHFANAERAMQKLVDFKMEREKGVLYTDESGEIYHKDNTLVFKGNKNNNLLKLNYDNYNLLVREIKSAVSIDDATKEVILKFIPESMQLVGSELHVNLSRRSINTLNLKLEEKHVKWVMNRLFDIAGYMSLLGYNHNGLSPYSTLVTPADHGLQVFTFYHMVRQNFPLKTVSGLIKRWYPEKVFVDKVSNSDIDSSLIRLFAGSLLLGKITNDPGPELRGNIDDGLLKFLMSESQLVITDSLRYRTYLDLKPKEFFVLNL